MLSARVADLDDPKDAELIYNVSPRNFAEHGSDVGMGAVFADIFYTLRRIAPCYLALAGGHPRRGAVSCSATGRVINHTRYSLSAHGYCPRCGGLVCRS